MNIATILVIYWLICIPITVYIFTKQNEKISIDGVIGNTPNFAMLFAVLGGGLFVPLYCIIKGIKLILKY